jgi:polyphosphate kinase
MEKEANYDAIEDAIKACESAYLFGYNIGGSLSIPIACEALLAVTEDEYKKEVLTCISNAMKNVFKEVLRKYYSEESDSETVDQIVEQCVINKTCYDLINKEYSNNIINPCMTDIEVLKGAASLSSVLLNSNQYLAMLPNEKI